MAFAQGHPALHAEHARLTCYRSRYGTRTDA